MVYIFVILDGQGDNQCQFFDNNPSWQCSRDMNSQEKTFTCGTIGGIFAAQTQMSRTISFPKKGQKVLVNCQIIALVLIGARHTCPGPVETNLWGSYGDSAFYHQWRWRNLAAFVGHVLAQILYIFRQYGSVSWGCDCKSEEGNKKTYCVPQACNKRKKQKPVNWPRKEKKDGRFVSPQTKVRRSPSRNRPHKYKWTDRNTTKTSKSAPKARTGQTQRSWEGNQVSGHPKVMPTTVISLQSLSLCKMESMDWKKETTKCQTKTNNSSFYPVKDLSNQEQRCLTFFNLYLW